MAEYKRGTMVQGNDTVTIEGYVENAQLLERLLTKDAEFAKAYRKLIRKALQSARRRIGSDVRANIGIAKDPRDAYKAVKMAVYKTIFGGNVSILSKRKASNLKTSYHPPRTMSAGQRGGNRVPMSARTLMVNSYYGADRGFILRWLEAGTKDRFAGTRGGRLHGRRSKIGARHTFSSNAPAELEKAIEEIAEAFAEYINTVING